MKTTTVSIDINQFLSYGEWFVQEVNNGLKEAKQGEFASNAEVEAKFQKWGINAG